MSWERRLTRWLLCFLYGIVVFNLMMFAYHAKAHECTTDDLNAGLCRSTDDYDVAREQEREYQEHQRWNRYEQEREQQNVFRKPSPAVKAIGNYKREREAEKSK